MKILNKLNLLKEFYTYYQLGSKQLSRQEIKERHNCLLPEFANNLQKSAFYRNVSLTKIEDLSQFPIINKQIMNEKFNIINTENLDYKKCADLNIQAERTRDFSPKIENISIGSSSGTSGKPSVFAISPLEQVKWAGFILGKSISLWESNKIALFLRTGNQLYSQLNAGWLNFHFFDLYYDIKEQIKYLDKYQPTVLVAPAQVLKMIALYQQEGLINIKCKKIYNAAEVLDDSTKLLLETVFKQPIHQIYQATEGFLGITCEYGQLHLNEENLYIEKEWLDENRFVPIVTDLLRTTQPVVRYKLDDILVVKKSGCLCHRGSTVIEKIEGRVGDTIKLFNKNNEIKTIFSDMLLKIITSTIRYEDEFNLVQTGRNTLVLHMNNCKSSQLVQENLDDYFKILGVENIKWEKRGYCPNLMSKRRKISCEKYE